MASTHCVYIDDVFFKEAMNEKDDERSFPVKMTSMRMGWIINEPEGKKFLKAILKN